MDSHGPQQPRFDIFELTSAGFIYFAANTDNAVKPALNTGIVVNSILTAFEFGNVPNSDIYFNNALISDFTKISTFPLIPTFLKYFLHVPITDNAVI